MCMWLLNKDVVLFILKSKEHSMLCFEVQGIHADDWWLSLYWTSPSNALVSLCKNKLVNIWIRKSWVFILSKTGQWKNKDAKTSELRNCHLFCRAHSLNSSHAFNRRSSSVVSPQMFVSRSRVFRMFPAIHKSQPRCTTCIAHHFIMPMVNPGTRRRGP